MKKYNLINLFIVILLLMLNNNCSKNDENNVNSTVTDIDGNVYHTITIGKQVWMVENLKVTRFNDGTSIPLVTDNMEWSKLSTPGYCWYNNNHAEGKISGALYNGYTISTGKLCPKGWHVPYDLEWKILEDYLMSNGYNYDGSISDNKYAKAQNTIFLLKP